MASKFVSMSKQAEVLKDQGNLYFKKERFGAAIEAYTEAITLSPNVPVYWTNRALCYRKRNEWGRVESDCRKALELDNCSVKAHYMLGLSLLQSKHHEDAVKQLEKALDLSRCGKPSSYMVEEIWLELAKAKYTEWEVSSNTRRRRQKEIREICEKALKEDYEAAIEKLNVKKAIDEDIELFEDVMVEEVILLDDEGEAESIQGSVPSSKVLVFSRLSKLHKERMEALSEIFEKASCPDRPVEIPDYLCCKITMDIFRDPVISPSGVTYERAVILEHLEKVGKFDPLTRADLRPEQLVPNLSIKEAVQSYLSENGWAYKMF